MTREIDLVSYLPPFLAEFKEIAVALEAENPEFVLVWNAAERVLQNEFIETADEYGISRFERLLGIYPERGTSLETRRKRIFDWWFMPLPYTWRKLLEKLASVCGKDGFTARRYPDEYRIEVEILPESIPDVRDAIHSMLPVNMAYVLIFSYGAQIWNTERIQPASLRLYYKLFGWQGHEFRECLAFRWTVYEPSNMEFLPFQLLWKIYMQSKVTVGRLRLHIGMMYWGADGLLDGSWLLDGSRLLDACRRYGVLVGTRFGSMKVEQESSAALHDLAIQWQQKNSLANSRTKVKQRISVAFFGVPLTLDGSWLLDGSVLLDAGLRYSLRPALKVALAVEMPTQEVDGTAETKTEDYWLLDGSVPLDGSRCLDSVYRKESLE